MDMHEVFFDGNLKFEKVIYLPGNSSDVSSDLSDLLDFDPDAVVDAFRETGIEIDPEYTEDEEAFMELCARKRLNGFLIEVHTPVPSNFCGGGYTYSWGLAKTNWFYTNEIDTAFIDRVLKWKKAIHDRERAIEQNKGGQP